VLQKGSGSVLLAAPSAPLAAPLDAIFAAWDRRCGPGMTLRVHAPPGRGSFSQQGLESDLPGVEIQTSAVGENFGPDQLDRGEIFSFRGTDAPEARVVM